MTESNNAIYLAPDELCIGIFVCLDLNWLQHDFRRSNFKIKSTEQLVQLRRLGLKRIRIDPAKSDNWPPASNDMPVAEEASIDSVHASVAEENASISPPSVDVEQTATEPDRVSRAAQQRAAAARCEADFSKAAMVLKDINNNLFSRPAVARASAEKLVGDMLDSILEQKDIAIHLMNDKVGGEELYFHSLNVAVLAMMLARHLQISEADIKQLGIGCLFHDIGKINIPDRVRLKTEALTRAERNLLNHHPQYGLDMVAKLGLSPLASSIIAQHHEHIDGSGYPSQLKGSQISLLARIAAIVNTYDNLCNQPNLADSVSPYEALSQMFAQQRHRFDEGPLTTFIHCMGVYPPGTIVELSDQSLGIVVSVNPSKPLRPNVLIYDPQVPKNEAIILDLLSEPDLSVVSSLKPSHLTRDVYDYLSPRKRTTYYFGDLEKNTSTKH